MTGNVKMFRGIKVKFLSPTNFLGSRIKLTDEIFSQSKTINYKHTVGNTLDQAVDYLQKNGFNVVGYTEMKNEYIVLCDNWNGNCIKLDDIRGVKK